MKKYVHLLQAVIIQKQNEDGSFETTEFVNPENDIFPLRFYAVPNKGDIFFLDEIYYEVLLVQFEVAKKNWPRPIYFAEGKLLLRKIGDIKEFRKNLIKLIS